MAGQREMSLQSRLCSVKSLDDQTLGRLRMLMESKL